MAEKGFTVRLSARVDAYVRAMREARNATDQFSKETLKNLDSTGRGMQKVGSALTKYVTVPLAGLGVGAVVAATKWESSWAGVTKTVDGTAEQMARLEQGLRDMAKELPASHSEIAAVAEAAGQLGVRVEDIEKFTRTMIDLGETTNLTSDEAATAIAQMMNVMGTAGEDVDRLGATLVELGNNGASTEKQIIEMAQRIAASGELIGLTEAEVLGFANALASVGIEVEAGGTAISRVMQRISKMVAAGGDDLAYLASVAGMTADEFTVAFRDTPAEAIATFIDGLGRIHAAGGNVFGVLETLSMSDVRVSDALLRMATAGDLLRDSLEMGTEAWESNTALTQEAQKRYETFASQVQVLRNQAVDLGIDIGRLVIPILRNLVDVASGLISWFQGLPGPVQMVAVAFGTLLAAIGPMLYIGGSLLRNLRDITSAISAFSRMAPGVALAMGTLGAMMAGYAIHAARAAARQRELADSMNEVARSSGEQQLELLVDTMMKAALAGDTYAEAIGELVKGNAGLADALIENIENSDSAAAAALRQEGVLELLREARAREVVALEAQADQQARTNELMGDGADAADEQTEALEAELAALLASNDAAEKATTTREAFAKAMSDAHDEIREANRLLQEQIDRLLDLVKAHRASSDATFRLHDAEDKLAEVLATANERVAEAGDDWRAVRQILDEVAESAAAVADAEVELAEQTAAANGETFTATERMDLWNRAMLEAAAAAEGPLRDAILNHIARVNGIPEERITEIAALLDSASVSVAEVALQRLSATRKVTIQADLNQESIAEAERKMNAFTRDRFANVHVKLAGVDRRAIENMRIADRGGSVGPGTLVAERRPEFVNGMLLTSPAITTAPASVTSGATTARILQEIARNTRGKGEKTVIGAQIQHAEFHDSADADTLARQMLLALAGR